MQNLFRHARSGPSRTGDAEHFSLRRWFRLLLVPIVAGMFLASGFSGTARADSGPYSCGDEQSNHCYNEVIWPGGTNGVQTSVFTNQIWGGDCFVANETRLTQHTPSGDYWVEAGIISSDAYGQESEALFWADKRPTDKKFEPHYGAFLENNDLGKFAKVQITKNHDNTFDITINGLPQASLHDTSTNSFIPDTITIGMELCGTSGASAEQNGFTNNQYQGPKNDNWYYQFTDGSVQHFGGRSNDGYPIGGAWHPEPAGKSNNGGEFRTCIPAIICD